MYYFECVDQTCEYDDRSTMLIIMKYWDSSSFFEFFFDVKTLRRFDVLQINTSESSRNTQYRLDDLVRILSIKHNRHCIDSAKLLKQDTLTFHDRQRRKSAKIS